MENFKELKNLLFSGAIKSKATDKQLREIEDSETWEELKEVIVDNIWWCGKKIGRFLPDGHYKTNKMELSIENGELNGEHKRWWSNGQIYSHSFYVNNKLHGEYKKWHANGHLDVHCTFKEGKLEGEHINYWSNGELKIRSFYKEDKRNGEYMKWYSSGQPSVHSFYKDGERDGEYKQWQENGQFREHSFYKNGKCVETII
jgi:antitoxin component YwqK of YwqJK toxin-antitoxin module